MKSITTYEEAIAALEDMQSQIIHGSKCFSEIAEIMRQLKSQWEKAEKGNERMREALKAIAFHKFIDYEVARNGIYEGQYGIGVVDGHRACSHIAHQAIAVKGDESVWMEEDDL